MTPRTFLPRHEWLPPDVNDSPEFLMPSLKLCSGVTLCMLFITLLTCWTQSRIMCTLLFPARSDLFYWWLNAIATPAMDHRTVNWNLFARLSISTLPATTLECSDANASGVLVLSFQSLKNDADMGRGSFPPRGVTAALGANVRGVIHASDHRVHLTEFPC